MKRVLFFVYGVGCHLMFLAVYALLAAFVGGFLLPKTIDSPQTVPLLAAGVVNLGLLVAFGVQHSVMARPAFKRVWTRLVPQPIERSTYVLVSNLTLLGLMWLWQPMPLVVWDVQNAVGWWLLVGLFVAGWLLVPAVSLMINHFDLFGSRQVWLHLQGKENEPLAFQTPLAYGWVRHPLYVAWMLAFWATPHMTLGHLLFASVLSAYMVAASKVEERDLVGYFGQEYEAYRRRVPAFVPVVWSRMPEQGENAAQPGLGYARLSPDSKGR
jgi:protein-S-isoprenylcysteine O-methyltransferase Ste14